MNESQQTKRAIHGRDLFKGVALPFLVLALFSSLSVVKGQTDRPNVLILFADDLGYGDVSYNGGDIPTPNIDALVADGVRFTW